MKWSHSDLYNQFMTFGNILSAKVSIDRHHVSKGYGYIQFETNDQALKAIEKVSILKARSLMKIVDEWICSF